jgi:hypothetical protein
MAKKAKASARSGASKKAGPRKAVGKAAAKAKKAVSAASKSKSKSKSKSRKKTAARKPARKGGGLSAKAKKISSRVKEALRRDWMQTKDDVTDHQGRDLNQDAADTVKQAVGAEEIPPRGDTT